MRLSIALPTPPPPAGTPVTVTVRCPDAAAPALNTLAPAPLSAPATALCGPATAAYEGVVAAGRVVFLAPATAATDKDAWRRPPAVRYTPTLAVPFNPPAGSVVEARAHAADKTYTAAALVPAPAPDADPNKTTAADLTINLTLREGATAPTPPPGPAPQPADGLIISPLQGPGLEDGDAYTLDTAPGADRIVVVQ